jgi:hypothetical protein
MLLKERANGLFVQILFGHLEEPPLH